MAKQSSKQVKIPKSTDVELDNMKILQDIFIQTVSHELRTPLTVLKGYADLLSEGELGDLAPEQKEAMFIIANRAQELNTVISRIGALLAVESGAVTQHAISLSALIAQMLEKQRAMAKANGIKFEAKLPPNLPHISGDRQQLQEAVECLIENAIKFTPNGGHVTLTLDAQDDEVYLSVTDTGIGIEESDLTELFLPFHQLDGSPTRRYGGLGLGLTVVHKVVEAHDGELEVESELGEGSTFTVKLPALKPASVQDQDTAAAPAPDIPMHRILIVDDEEFVAFTLQEGLEKLPNCEVMITDNGKDALRLFAEQPFDLLITDYKMPEMTGVALATQIRQKYPETGVVMVTGYSNDLLRDPSAAAAIQRVLDKPVKLSEIRNVAQETLDEILKSQAAASADGAK
ncbi:MAG: response regulator [Chloroflexi bacterium]|nr:response regulator [Chloroflexota bacterium]